MRAILLGLVGFFAIIALGCGDSHADRHRDTPVASAPPPPSGDDHNGHGRSSHPRLMMTDATIPALKAEIAANTWLAQRYAVQKANADTYLTRPVSVYDLRGTDGLLGTSRHVLDRVAVLAIVYRVENDPRYLKRCWEELEAASQFPEWDRPKHFLSIAEMTTAFAIGYDWLYDAWTAEQRATLRQAIIDHGLQPGLAIYRNQSSWWPSWDDNWNLVCNGGMIVGALAIQDESPDIANEVLHHALASVPKALAKFGPDGGWVEGPNYWSYATLYAAILLDSLQTARGSDGGLDKIAGVRQTGWFPVYLNGNGDGPFNFGDAEALHKDRSGPQLLWWARHYHEPRLAQYAIDHPTGRIEALDLIWGAGIEHEPWQTIPTERVFHHVEVASMRDNWTDPNGWFIAMKAGRNSVSHGHLDVGSFVLDAMGVRWAVLLGPDSYGLPGYFQKQRWNYYRLRAEGNNTLVINPSLGPDQAPHGAATIESLTSQKDSVDVIADLTGVYPDAESAKRHITFIRGKSAQFKDDIQLKQPGDVWWFMHTPAQATPSADGRTLTLTKSGKTMQMKLLTPDNATFEVGPAQPLPTSPNPSGQNANDGITRIAIHLSQVQRATITVQFESGNAR